MVSVHGTRKERPARAQEARHHRIDTTAPIKRRRNIIAGLLSMIDMEYAHHMPASEWLKKAKAASKLPATFFVPCVHCVKGGRRSLKVILRPDYSYSIQCCSEDDCHCGETELPPPADREALDQLATEGATWLAKYEEYAKQDERPWLYAWIEKVKALTHGPASKTLQTMLRIYALVRKRPSRLTVDETRGWIGERGWKPARYNEPTALYDGEAVPILLKIDLADIAPQVGLSKQHVSKYLRMMVRLRLLRVAAREEHGQIVYQAGWWSDDNPNHPRPDWFLYKGKKWKARLLRISSGQIRLQ